MKIMSRSSVAAKTIPAVCILLFLSGCLFDRPIKPPQSGSADQLYKEGVSQMGRKNYRQAIEAFYKLKYDYPTEVAAMIADLKIADAHYADKKYEQAIDSYDDFRKMHPASSYIPYVVYMLGLCNYKLSYSIDRDQTYTQKALNEFQYLLTHFPNTPYFWDATEKAKACMKKLFDHELYVGDFYFRIKNYRASLDRYEAALKKYPDVPVEPKNLYRLGILYQKTDRMDEARKAWVSVINNHPKSKYSKKSQHRLEKFFGPDAIHRAKENKGSTSSMLNGPSRKTAEAASDKITGTDERQQPEVRVAGASERNTEKTPIGTPHSSARSPTPDAGQKATHRLKSIPISSTSNSLILPHHSRSSESASAEIARKFHPKKPAADIPDPADRLNLAGLIIHPSELRYSEKTEAVAFSTVAVDDHEDAVDSAVNSGPPEPEALASDAPVSEDGTGDSSGDAVMGFSALKANRPLNITADRMDALERENKIIFQGNVIIQQDETYIRADRISAFLAKDDSGGGIQKVVALRNVRITEKDHVATCDRAEFDNVSRVIELSGNPKIWQGKDRIDGDKVILNLGEERVTITGSENRRVYAVLFPKTGEDKVKKPEVPSGPRPSFSVPFAKTTPDVQSAETKPETVPEKPSQTVEPKPVETVTAETEPVTESAPVQTAEKEKPAPEPEKKAPSTEAPTVKAETPFVEKEISREAAILTRDQTLPLPVMRPANTVASTNEPGIRSEGIKHPERISDHSTASAPVPARTEHLFKPAERSPSPASAWNRPSSSRSFDLQQPYRPVQNTGIRPLDESPPSKNQSVDVLGPKTGAPAMEQPPGSVVETKITAAEDEAEKAAKKASVAKTPEDRVEKKTVEEPPVKDEKDTAKAAAVRPKSLPEEPVKDFIERWRRAWESLDVGSYMAFYSDDFRGSGKNKTQWRSLKESLSDRYSFIRVELDDMKITPMENGFHVTFVQKYQADRFGDVGIKDLFVRSRDKRWEIVKENWKPLEDTEKNAGAAVAQAEKQPTPASSDRPDERKTLRTILDRWRLSWQNRDRNQHFSLYSEHFRSGTSDLDHWRMLRTQKMNSTKTISVGITDIHIVIRDGSALATFVQDYQEDRYRDRGIKSLRFEKEQGEWRIVDEQWKPL